MQLVGTLDTQLYTGAELPVFHNETENPVILGRAPLLVNQCDMVLIGICSK